MSNRATAWPSIGSSRLLYEELGRSQTALVEERELQKAKNNAVAEFYRTMKTIDGKANALGTYDVIFGDYRKLFQAADNINRVTREDLQRVARKYFEARNRTVAILAPGKSVESPPGRRGHEKCPTQLCGQPAR